jgi:hypothetical protein
VARAQLQDTDSSSHSNNVVCQQPQQ